MTFIYRTKHSPTIQSNKTFVNINFNQNVWQHIAVVVCGYDLSLFIDGKLVRTDTLVGVLNGVTADLRIGQNSAGMTIFYL